MACWLLAVAWQNPGRLFWWAAPTYKQDEQGFEKMEELATNAGVLAGARFSEGRLSMRLINGSKISFVSWEKPKGLSGATVSALVVDEAHDLTQEAWKILRARLSATLGPIRLIGNTGDIEGQFKAICDRAADPAQAHTYGFHRWTWREKSEALGSSVEGREYAAFIEEERESSPEWEFSSVWEANWLESTMSVFSGVEAASTLEPRDRPAPGVPYVIGWDIAESVDFTVGIPIPCVPKVRDIHSMLRFRRQEGAMIVERIAGFGEEWNDALHVVEVNGEGRFIYQELARKKKRVMPWTTANQNKHDAVILTSADLQWGRLRLAALPPLQAELKAFRRKRNPSGSYSYSAPDGGHDDTVMSLIIGNASRRLVEAYRPVVRSVRVS